MVEVAQLVRVLVCGTSGCGIVPRPSPMNIEDIKIDMIVRDTTVSNKSICGKALARVINKTSNSVEVFMKAKTVEGIDCSQWFLLQDFNKRFIGA